MRGKSKRQTRFITQSVAFLRKQAKKRKIPNAVIGLSGGIDSAVVAVLCKIAFKDNLTALALPSSRSSIHSLEDAKLLAQYFNIPLKIIALNPYDTAFYQANTNCTSLQFGNFCARLRMAMLYHFSSQNNALVIGTSNKSELMLGYGTIFGDLACSINPIGSLFKTEIFTLARALDIPESIINKPPSADLYENQSDELELGFTYAQIDPLLAVICEKYGDFTNTKKYKKIDYTYFVKKGFNPDLVKMVTTRIQANLFKREMPLIFMQK